ncbi:hypothetical protein NE237_013108 [Protea cynaroides]|uniref:Uncharacterized protein n=1 Tax=Protea cynaroides TaxID=273540 RepID=A0A9Q0GZA9_9MAGN|nr:hypothetical protein NE237_013108 [Protea cynaroides]
MDYRSTGLLTTTKIRKVRYEGGKTPDHPTKGDEEFSAEEELKDQFEIEDHRDLCNNGGKFMGKPMLPKDLWKGGRRPRPPELLRCCPSRRANSDLVRLFWSSLEFEDSDLRQENNAKENRVGHITRDGIIVRGWDILNENLEKLWFTHSGDTSSSRTLIYTKNDAKENSVEPLRGMESKVQAKKKG